MEYGPFTPHPSPYIAETFKGRSLDVLAYEETSLHWIQVNLDNESPLCEY